MKIVKEALLTQLGYNITETELKELDKIIQNTKNFDKIKNHILSLHDHLKEFFGFVALSNSKPYFKIKIDTDNPSQIEAATEEINHWATKYNVKLEKVENKNTYYILGVEK